MTQPEIDREVSRVTGESMGTIKRRGFSILPLPGDYPDDDQHPNPFSRSLRFDRLQGVQSLKLKLRIL